jgi:hypothetical protein
MLTTAELFVSLYALLIFINLIITLLYSAINKFYLLKSPKELYEQTCLNWFGALFGWVLEVLLNPMPWIMFAIFWLCTAEEGKK